MRIPRIYLVLTKLSPLDDTGFFSVSPFYNL